MAEVYAFRFRLKLLFFQDLVANILTDGNGYVFPGLKSGKPLSNMAMAMAMAMGLRRAGLSVTVQGFRSSFSD
jgi:hypothetical protein